MAPIVTPRRREDFFDEKGEPTLRFVSWIELVTRQTNDSTSTIGELPPSTLFSPQVQQLKKQINGLPELTIDTSGFTTDLTFITTDKVIA